MLTLSGFDSYNNSTMWGTTRFNVIFLRKTYNPYKLKITSSSVTSTTLMLDYVDMQEVNHDNAVKGAMAWIA